MSNANMSQSEPLSNGALKSKMDSTHPVTDKVQDTLHESVDTLAQRAAATEASLRKSAQDGSQNLSAKQKELENAWNKSSVKQYATENPVATAGIAFAAGMLVSALFKGK